MAQGVNWVEIKDIYVAGELDKDGRVVYPTNKVLAERFGIAYKSLALKIREENWATEKKLYLDNLEKRKRESRIESLAVEAADFDNRILCVAKSGLTHIEKYFQRAKDDLEIDKPLPIDALEKLSRCVDKYQKIGRLALGENIDSVHSTTDSWLDLYKVVEDG